MGEVILTGENRSGETPVLVPRYLPQNSRGLARDRTWTSAARGWRLTA